MTMLKPSPLGPFPHKAVVSYGHCSHRKTGSEPSRKLLSRLVLESCCRPSLYLQRHVGLFGWRAQKVHRIKLQVFCHILENVKCVSFQCPAIVLDTVHKGLIVAYVLSHLVR